MGNRIGQLVEINGTMVLIDDTWYDAVEIAKYLPPAANIQVEFDADTENVLKFMRQKKAFTPKNTTPYKKPSKGTPYKSDRTESIVNQVLLKIASEQVSNFTYNDPSESLEVLDRVFIQLKAKYFDELTK
jgi:hypothetical protein